MLEYLSWQDGGVKIYFSDPLEKEFFQKIFSELEGVEFIKTSSKSNSLFLKVRKGSPAEVLLKYLSPIKREGLTKADVYYYLSLFLKNPLIKLLIALSTLGIKPGIVSFVLCSLIITPWAQRTFSK